MAKSPKQYRPEDLSHVKRYSVELRRNKATPAGAGRPLAPSANAGRFFESLPKYLKAADLNEFIEQVARARKKNRPFHLLLGAHPIKIGLSPIIIDLMKR